MTARIRVLLVDDSRAVRRAIAAILAATPDVELVGEAADGQEALALALRLRPEVILLDLEMPRMDGFTFLRFLRAQTPTPVLVLSRHSGRADIRRALELGAFGFVSKPSANRLPSQEDARGLLQKIRSIRGVDPAAAARPRPRPVAPRVALVAASTGGPAAVLWLVSRLPARSQLALVVAQHMPARFTGAFAERLDRSSPLSVAEALDGDPLLPGRCLIAPGGKNVALTGSATHPVVAFDSTATRHQPSADLLFASAARLLGASALGIVLTGMGDDGKLGLRELLDAGSETIAEASETAVVFGMPKAAIELGAARRILPLPAILAALIEFSR